MVVACHNPKIFATLFTSTRVDRPIYKVLALFNSVVWDNVRITVMIMASIIRIYSMRCLKDGMNKDRLG